MDIRRPALALAAALLVAGCSGGSDSSDKPDALAGCTPGALTTKTPGRLTLSTGPITRAPWVVGGEKEGRGPDPRQGQGYDAAVGFALAKRLGYAPDQVAWMSTPFADAVAAGVKEFDVNVNQATISPERAKEVDLSTSYFDVPQAVVTLSTDPSTAGASALDALRGKSFAVLRGSAAEAAIAGIGTVVAYDDPDDVRRAVSEKRQTALVTDLITAMRYDTDEQQLVDGDLVGTLPVKAPAAESYGLVLQKGSPLTSCVDKALDSMRADGELAGLQARWLSQETGWAQLS